MSLSMIEPACGAIERVRFGHPEPARSELVPEIEPGPVRRPQNLVGIRRKEWIGKKDRHLLLVVPVVEAQAPGDRGAGFVEPPIELRAGGPAVPGQRLGCRIVARSLVRADAEVEVR